MHKTPGHPVWSRRHFLAGSGAGLLTLAAGMSLGCRGRADFDILLTGGNVFDGSGSEPILKDVGIRDGQIAEIGELRGKTAPVVVDARGMAVAPGFVDIHGHSDIRLLVDGLAQSKIRQGVTTEFVGQDGGSVAPLTEQMRESRSGGTTSAYGLELDWTDFSGYFARLQRQGISINLGSMVGAGTIREYVIGFENRPASASELQEMRELVARCIAQGVRHLSSGLEYTPGSFADAAELSALCNQLGSGGMYASHIRNEDDRLEDAIAEAVTIARDGGCALHVSHLKAQGKRNWGRLPRVFDQLSAARESGMRVSCDRYPYVAYSTGLTNLFPLWSREGGRDAFLARLQDATLQGRLQRAVEEKIAGLGDWDAVQISSLPLPEHARYEGARLGSLAASEGQPPFAFLKSILLAGRGGSMVGFGMSEENTETILAHGHTVVASDGSARATSGPLSGGSPHPRNFGTFPRVLGHYVRDRKIMSLAQAIRKMTSLPASLLGLRDRGRIAPGLAADVVVFDPESVADTATFASPESYPVGIRDVFVNGVPVLRDGEHTGAKPGLVL